jgi:hypothetical protein
MLYAVNPVVKNNLSILKIPFKVAYFENIGVIKIAQIGLIPKPSQS